MRRISIGYQDAPTGSLQLEHYGPNLRVHVGFDPTWTLKSKSAPKPSEFDLQALIDTGAKQSCIDSALAARIDLPFFDRRPVSSCTGVVKVDFCRAQIHVPSLQFTQTGAFAAVPLVASGFKYDVILGRSFLNYLRLEYDGTTGEVILLFQPPKEKSLSS